MKFHPDFEKLISDYDFGDFSISGVHFGNGNNYLEKLRDLQTHLSQENLLTFTDQYICIATGDYYSILTNTNTGHIFAFANNIPFDKKICVSQSFSLFIRSLGTAYLFRKEGRGIDFLDIAEQNFGMNSLNFWRETV
ncbi:hypothetical protein [Paenibacillus elgii]|uniref:hypothetical protein n=1 Tax=Paenibacillus elgii TaxID=189691 RepID=UPI000FDC1E8E|nr:hypothetical protein [Paenibacillus elgii]NEN82434.1 hypothetical protein [Paenibacillus elgii]